MRSYGEWVGFVVSELTAKVSENAKNRYAPPNQ